MSNEIRNHKDNVFCMLYREKKHLLSLYNAVGGTSYEDEEELKKIAPPGSLYSTKTIRILSPRFVVFYNGIAMQPERQTYKLSDLFEREEAEPELELKVTVFNINHGYNGELMEKCESLRGYMTFVEKARKKKSDGIPLEQAVPEAVDECVAEGVLADFFKVHRKEIVKMGILEFDQELYEKTIREDAEAIGLDKGIRICQQIYAGNMDSAAIAKVCGYTMEEVESIRKQFEI